MSVFGLIVGFINIIVGMMTIDRYERPTGPFIGGVLVSVGVVLIVFAVGILYGVLPG